MARDNSLCNSQKYFEMLDKYIEVKEIPTNSHKRGFLGIFCLDNIDTILMFYEKYRRYYDICIIDKENTIEALKIYLNDSSVVYINYENDSDLNSDKLWEKIAKMMFDYIIMNPPFKEAGDMWDKARKHSDEVVCLGPLSMYKSDERYQYIGEFDMADSRVFKDAEIGDNLCITTARKIPNKKASYTDYMFETFNKNWIEFYKWNREHFIGLTVVQCNSNIRSDFNREIDFLTSNRGCSFKNYFATDNGMDSIYNLSDDEVKLNSGLALIRLYSKIARKNFNTWAYYKPIKERLINKTMKGLNLVSVGEFCSYAIPQIDWEIISDHPLWIEGKYDEAVLDTMGLKWNETMTGVTKK